MPNAAIDQAGFIGIGLIAYHFGGVLGAGIGLTVASLVTAIIVSTGRQ